MTKGELIPRILAIIIVFGSLAWFGYKENNPGTDCWTCAYKKAYCLTLVDLGLARDDCDTVVLPDQCWTMTRAERSPDGTAAGKRPWKTTRSGWGM